MTVGIGPVPQEALLNASIDLAVMTDPSPSRVLACKTLVREELVLVTAPRMRPENTFVTERELRTVPLIMTEPLRKLIDGMIERLGLKLNVELELNSSETIRYMVRQGLGSSILPYALVREDALAGVLQAHRILQTGLHRDLAVATAISRPPSRSASAVAEVTNEAAAELARLNLFSLPGPAPQRRRATP